MLKLLPLLWLPLLLAPPPPTGATNAAQLEKRSKHKNNHCCKVDLQIVLTTLVEYELEPLLPFILCAHRARVCSEVCACKWWCSSSMKKNVEKRRKNVVKGFRNVLIRFKRPSKGIKPESGRVKCTPVRLQCEVNAALACRWRATLSAKKSGGNIPKV